VPVPCVDWDRRDRGGLRVRRWVECPMQTTTKLGGLQESDLVY
jgi:hypothetical protein